MINHLLAAVVAILCIAFIFGVWYTIFRMIKIGYGWFKGKSGETERTLP